MTQKDKELLLKDLCARVPYRVRLEGYVLPCIILTPDQLLFMYAHQEFAIRRPYLRPMSSISSLISAKEWSSLSGIDLIDWYNANHIDYRNLIPKGLALEAPEGMY